MSRENLANPFAKTLQAKSFEGHLTSLEMRKMWEITFCINGRILGIYIKVFIIVIEYFLFNRNIFHAYLFVIMFDYYTKVNVKGYMTYIC